MEIKTKYNIDDVVHFMLNNKPNSMPIKGFDVFYGMKTESSGVRHNSPREASKHTPFIIYYLGDDGGTHVPEPNCYPSREELEAAVFAKN